MMKPLVQTYPPLGQVTPLQSGRVNLRAILEVSDPQQGAPWEIALWHSIDGAQWAESSLQPDDAADVPQCLQPQNPAVTKNHYILPLDFKKSLRFTLKYRQGREADWLWAYNEEGIPDGTLVVQEAQPISEDLNDLIDLGPEWEVASCLSQAPKTLLWSLQASISTPELNSDSACSSSTIHDIPIGKPRISLLRWFALVRHSPAWLGPRQGKEQLFLDKDAVLCAFITQAGRCLVFLALAGIDDVLSVLQSTAEGTLSVHARCDNGGQAGNRSTVLVAESIDFGRAIAAVMYRARELSQASSHHPLGLSTEQKMVQENAHTSAHPPEVWYDGLSYCTWNSLGQSLTEDKVIEALDELSKNKIDVSTLIMDDNWQSIDYHGENQLEHGWLDFEAEAQSFPRGLKATVAKVRERHRNIRHVAVWHALLGYWGGISENGKLAQTYKTTTVPRRDVNLSLDGTMTVVDAEDVPRLYDDFYSFLVNSGVDSVKSDVQFMVDTWDDPAARHKLTYTYLDTWNRAAMHHFGMRTISSMSLFPQWLFHLLSASWRPTYPVRSSDDFFPDVPDSHPWHVWANAHNCIVLQFLNVVPDWDMFQSDHEFSGFHAAARCISGGPICITDVPGQHDMGIIRQITGKTPHGRTLVFRPSVIGKAISPFVGFGDNSLLAVGSYHGVSETGTSIMGLFHVSGCPVTELIPLSKFPGTVESLEYIVRAHTTGIVSAPARIESPRSLINMTLGVRGYEILCAFPLTLLPGKNHGTVSVANLGLIDKMTGCAAILQSNVHRRDNGRISIDTSLKALGVLGIYISCLPGLSIDRDFMITVRGDPVPTNTVTVSKADGHVLQVDIERAWESMELVKDGPDEVEVRVDFSA